jgi:hypothetical protein
MAAASTVSLSTDSLMEFRPEARRGRRTGGGGRTACAQLQPPLAVSSVRLRLRLRVALSVSVPRLRRLSQHRGQREALVHDYRLS